MKTSHIHILVYCVHIVVNRPQHDHILARYLHVKPAWLQPAGTRNLVKFLSAALHIDLIGQLAQSGILVIPQERYLGDVSLANPKA